MVKCNVAEGGLRGYKYNNKVSICIPYLNHTDVCIFFVYIRINIHALFPSEWIEKSGSRE